MVSDEFCLDKVNILGWLSYKKGDILHTDGVPIKGEASCFKSSSLSFHYLSDPKHGRDGFHATNDATQASGCAYQSINFH